MILYRSVGLQELEMIYDSGMQSFPARLPQQPIFYPVVQLAYARQIAADWNTQSGQSAGYVTQFKMDDAHLNRFEKHAVGGSQHHEFWIPAEELDEFNRHILGHIRVMEAYFGDTFQGFVPEQFGLQGKNAVEQFTMLANTFIYKRMEFYLEIRRNHKAIFLNYPFWLQHDFKNPGLKEKVLQAVKEAWYTSFPKIPLANPIEKDAAQGEQPASDSLVHPTHEASARRAEADPDSLADSMQEDFTFTQQPESNSSVSAAAEDTGPVEQAHISSVRRPEQDDTKLAKQPQSNFLNGVQLGLSGRYHEAIDEFSKAVGEDPNHVAAHTNLGIAFQKLGEDDRALSCYETALKIDPIYAEAHYFRANILYRQGNVREAIAGYTIAIGLQPELIRAHEKSAPQDHLTDYTDAPAAMRWIARPAHRILELNRTIEKDPEQAYLFKERATEYYRLRNYVQAIADYTSCLEMKPDDASVFHLRGLAYEQIGQTGRAQENYQRAMQINPQLSDEYIDRGVELGKMEQFRQSVASLSDGIRLAPQNPNGYINRGMSYFYLGDFENAINDFSNVIKLLPADETSYFWRAISCEELGRRQEAIADYEEFLKLSQNPDIRQEVERKLGQWNDTGQNEMSSQSAKPDESAETDRLRSEQNDQAFDLHDLMIALGERALHSTWFCSGVDSYGETAAELHAYTDQNKPIAGHDLLQITSGIHQTREGDFQAFDADATSPWIFIRAWDGSGFYIETNDPQIKANLKHHFQFAEEVEATSPTYTGLFIRI